MSSQRKFTAKQKTEINNLFNEIDYTNNEFYNEWFTLFEKGYLTDVQIEHLRNKVTENQEMLKLMDSFQQNKDGDFFKSMYTQLTEKKWLSTNQYKAILDSEEKYLKTKVLLLNYPKKNTKIFNSLETFFNDKGFLTPKQIAILEK